MKTIIDKQAVLAELEKATFTIRHPVLGFDMKMLNAEVITDRINALTSESMEPLTDMEQRIFLAAISREEKVCKKVDEEWQGVSEPDQVNLVKVCREIERKVKSALWTN